MSSTAAFTGIEHIRWHVWAIREQCSKGLNTATLGGIGHAMATHLQQPFAKLPSSCQPPRQLWA
eukprot:4172657-Pleurochrysis_carterae.AAC.1